MGHWIDPSWWTHRAISLSSQCSTTGVTKVLVGSGAQLGRKSAHGAMGCHTNHYNGPIQLFLVHSSQCSTTGVTKVLVGSGAQLW